VSSSNSLLINEMLVILLTADIIIKNIYNLFLRPIDKLSKTDL
jgi:hypothetical protein